MKKIAIFAVVLVLGTGVAFASSLNVPFFLDNAAPLGGSLAPSSGSVTFIGIKNTTSSDIVITLTYFVRNNDPNDSGFITTDPATAILSANQGLGWRPGSDDPGIEGAGNAIPDIVSAEAALGGAASLNVAGSATITWEGDPSDIIGRLVEIKSNSQSMYLLPPGN